MPEEFEPSLIYGLELQGRALSAVVADTENIRFLVGTQSLKSDNFVYIVTLDEDTGQLNKRVLKHTGGEVWGLNPNPEQPNIFLSTYGEKEKTTWKKKCAIWSVPQHRGSSEIDEGSIPAVELVADLSKVVEEGEMVGAWYQPNDASKLAMSVGDKVALVDLGSSGPLKVWESQHTVRGQTRIETSAWNPHRGCHQLSTVCGSQIISWDSRTGEKAWNINVNSGSAIRSLDFNPNKQYYLASGGDDGSVNIWDSRQATQPLSNSRLHSHWVWSVRFNSFHDQLLLSSGSDSRVLLISQASLSSEPYRQSLEDDDKPGGGQESVLEDGIIQTFTDHEDSVYTAEWSSVDPWTFASLSYDGRLVIGHVPKSIKYRILNLN
ncbi:EARP-interacting protein [Eurytemora carolleeae]|uniref:EARP-interacting protein n=1 Tax=Eurytemora carolleeae TaxID=1294199 RepID=UPI000C76EAED|nr:EARP-interacting protein [Eurytemora carolleeae]|eukprot:XP_023323899.1 EARP-interacting protein-like [Eurytemora affinis]